MVGTGVLGMVEVYVFLPRTLALWALLLVHFASVAFCIGILRLTGVVAPLSLLLLLYA